MKKIVYLFILLNSEKNEPRSAAAVIGLLGLSLRSPSGGLRNSLRSNSPRPFPSVSLASSPPDKGGIGDCCFCLYSNPLCFINPSVLRTPPLYFAAQNTEEEGEMYFPFASAPILYVIPCNVTGHGRGGGGEVSNVN